MTPITNANQAHDVAEKLKQALLQGLSATEAVNKLRHLSARHGGTTLPNVPPLWAPAEDGATINFQVRAEIFSAASPDEPAGLVVLIHDTDTGDCIVGHTGNMWPAWLEEALRQHIEGNPEAFTGFTHQNEPPRPRRPRRG